MTTRMIGTVVYPDGSTAELRLKKSGKVVYKRIRKSLYSRLKRLVFLAIGR